MKRSYRAVVFPLVLALSCGSSALAAVTPRVPTGKWVVDFADNQCLASRNYGTADKPLYLVLKPSPMGQVMQVSVARKGKFGEAIEVPATLRFDSREPIQSSLLAFTSKPNGVRFNSINLPTDIFAPMRQAKSFSIHAGREVNESFELAQMTSVTTAIERCLVDLQQFWNIGEAKSAKLKERARSKASLASYVSDDDYPSVAVQNRESGTVQFTLLIDETGKIADCMVVETSGVASLDGQTCAIMAIRAKFFPAIGVDGKPAKDALISRIRWIMP